MFKNSDSLVSNVIPANHDAIAFKIFNTRSYSSNYI